MNGIQDSVDILRQEVSVLKESSYVTIDDYSEQLSDTINSWRRDESGRLNEILRFVKEL